MKDLQTYWNIGRYIILELQNGSTRAVHNTRQIANLSTHLEEKFGMPFNDFKISYIKKLFLFFPNFMAQPNNSLTNSIQQHPQNTQSGFSPLEPVPNSLREAGGYTQPGYSPLWEGSGEALSLPHYIEILKSTTQSEAQFYQQQATQNNWSTRQLKQQIKNKLYYHVAVTAHYLNHETSAIALAKTRLHDTSPDDEETITRALLAKQGQTELKASTAHAA